MAVLRVPVSAEPLFQFVKGAPTERAPLSFFPTYAHLVAAGAGLGSALRIADHHPDLKDVEPRPIDFMTFQSQKLHHALMAYVLSYSRDLDLIASTDSLCREVEALASAGCRAMSLKLDEEGPQLFLNAWEEMVSEALLPIAGGSSRI